MDMSVIVIMLVDLSFQQGQVFRGINDGFRSGEGILKKILQAGPVDHQGFCSLNGPELGGF